MSTVIKAPPMDFVSIKKRTTQAPKADRWWESHRYYSNPWSEPDGSPPSGRARVNAAALLYDTAERIADGDVDGAFDRLFSEVDNLSSASRFDQIDELLIAARLHEFPLKLLVGMLTITFPLRTLLPDDASSRRRLVDEVRRRAVAMGGEKKARAVLHGLE